MFTKDMHYVNALLGSKPRLLRLNGRWACAASGAGAYGNSLVNAYKRFVWFQSGDYLFYTP